MMENNEFREPEILKMLNQMLGSKKDIMVAVAETMRVAVLKNFDKEGSRTGNPWQKLAHKTIEQRTEKGYWPGKILQRTGQLKRSIISGYGEDYAQVSTNLIYAAIQNYGGIIHRSSLKTYIRKKKQGLAKAPPASNKMGSIRIPARPFMKLNDQDIEKIKQKIVESLLGKK